MESPTPGRATGDVSGHGYLILLANHFVVTLQDYTIEIIILVEINVRLFTESTHLR